MCKKKNIFPSCISGSRRPLFFEQFAKFEFLKNISYLCYFSSHSLLFENESRNSLIGKWNSPYKYFSFNDFFYIRFFPWQNFLVIVGKSIFPPLLNFWTFRFSKEKIMGMGIFFFNKILELDKKRSKIPLSPLAVEIVVFRRVFAEISVQTICMEYVIPRSADAVQSGQKCQISNQRYPCFHIMEKIFFHPLLYPRSHHPLHWKSFHFSFIFFYQGECRLFKSLEIRWESSLIGKIPHCINYRKEEE